MRIFKLEEEEGVIVSLSLSSGEKFSSWRDFRGFATDATEETYYGSGVHQLVIGLKGEGEKPRILSTQTGGVVLKMKYKSLFFQDISQWGSELPLNKDGEDLLKGYVTNGKVASSPAGAVADGIQKSIGYNGAKRLLRNAPSLLDAVLCSSRLPGYDWKPAYSGGSLASPASRSTVYDNVVSYDITSSYPWSALAADVPVTRSVELTDSQREALVVESDGSIYVGENTGFLGLFFFKNFKRKSWVRVPFLRGDDVEWISDLEEDEYGILSGSIKIALSPLNLKHFFLQYDFEEMKILSMSIHGLGKLPKGLQDFLKTSYMKKESLNPNDPDRVIAKQALNTVVGLFGVDPFKTMRKTEVEDGYVLSTYNGSINESFLKYAGDGEVLGHCSGRIRSWDFRWATYILSHARYRMALTEKACFEAGLEVLYCDTDSLKVSGDEETIVNLFEKLNQELKFTFEGMGLWVRENPDFTRGVFIGPKVYVMENGAGEKIARAAGVKREEAHDSVEKTSLESIASGETRLIFTIKRRSPGTIDPSFGFGFTRTYSLREMEVDYSK